MYYFKKEMFCKEKKSEQSQDGACSNQEKEEEKSIFFSPTQFSKKSDEPSKTLLQDAEGHVFTANGFSLNLPCGWLSKTSYLLSGTQEQGEQISIQIAVEEDTCVSSVAEYAQQQLAVLQTHLTGYCLLQQEEIVIPNGQKAYQVEFCWNADENQLLYQQRVYVLSKNIGYCLMSILTEEIYKNNREKISCILRSFKAEQGDLT
ncbi:MAG: DcrB-related protein [bacterium]